VQQPDIPDFAEERRLLREARQRYRDARVADLRAKYESKDMAELTREEIDAKLDAAAARTEAVVARIEGKIDAIAADMRAISNANAELREDNRGHRGLLIGTGITLLLTVLGTGWAVFSGLTANNSSLIQAVTGAFALGRDVGQQIEQGKGPAPPVGSRELGKKPSN
jgi:hypothetical protein